MGVQVPYRVHAAVPQEGAVRTNQAALGHCIPRACPAIWIAQNVERKLRNFLGHKFWARGYFSTVGRDEEMIRNYIKNQEMADKQLDQLQLKLATS